MSQRPGTPMDRPMGTPISSLIPFTRTPEERAMEMYQKKKEMEGKIKEKVGEFGRAVTGTKVARFAGDIAGTAGGSVLGTKGGAMAGGTIGAAVGLSLIHI